MLQKLNKKDGAMSIVVIAIIMVFLAGLILINLKIQNEIEESERSLQPVVPAVTESKPVSSQVVPAKEVSPKESLNTGSVPKVLDSSQKPEQPSEIDKKEIIYEFPIDDVILVQ